MVNNSYNKHNILQVFAESSLFLCSEQHKNKSVLSMSCLQLKIHFTYHVLKIANNLVYVSTVHVMCWLCVHLYVLKVEMMMHLMRGNDTKHILTV